MPALRYDNCLNKSHSEHFKDIIGVTLETGKEPVEIIASITPSQAPYIITKPIHDSQKVLEENENEITISIRILPNYEFYSTILSFGSSIKIVSPEFVREEVYNKLKIAYRNYEV